jgi:Protein of unknown function (DUF2975)
VNQPRASGAATTGYVVVTLLLVLAALVYPAFKLAEYGRMLFGNASLDVTAQLDPGEVELPDGVRLQGWPDIRLEIEDPTTDQILHTAAMDVGPWLLVVAVLWLLWGLARSVRRRDPFGHENVKRLRSLGFLLVLGAPLVELFNSAVRASLLNELPPGRFGDFGMAGFELPATALLGGLGAFILAEVFAYGLGLREDVEGTI